MQPFLYYFYLVLAGLAGGFLSGLLGLGGGIVFIVVLPVALAQVGVPAEEIVQYTIANSLMATLFSSLSGSITQYRHGNFQGRAVLAAGMFSVVVSSLVLEFIVNTPYYSREVFNVIVIVLLFYMMVRTLGRARRDVPFVPQPNRPKWHYGVVGVSSGVISPLSGLGGGVVMVPILNSILKVPIKKANSVSLGIIFVTSLSATAVNLLSTPRLPFTYHNVGYIVFPVAIGLVFGTLLGAPLGVRAANRLPAKVLSYTFAVVLGLVIVRKAMELFG